MGGIRATPDLETAKHRMTVGWLGIVGGAFILANIAVGYLVFQSFYAGSGAFLSPAALAIFAIGCWGTAAGIPGIAALAMGIGILRGRGNGRSLVLVGVVALFGSVLLVLAIAGTLLGLAGSTLLLVAGVLAHVDSPEILASS